MRDNTGRAQGDAIERATMDIEAMGRSLEEGRLWRVVHADGTEWTTEQLRELVANTDGHHLVYCDVVGFAINDIGEVAVYDSCDNLAFADQLGAWDDMRVEWLRMGGE